MTHGSLFSGIGGFDLAAAWAGIPTLWQVENNEFCRAILQKHFPDADRSIRDVFEASSRNLKPVDIITGGFPCQDISIDGHKAGITGDRFLWPEMLRVILELEPDWVIAENVVNLGNVALRLVCSDLEAGYETIVFDIAACAANLQTMERHLWIIAARRGKRMERCSEERLPNIEKSLLSFGRPISNGAQGIGDRWNLSESRLLRTTKGFSNFMERMSAIGNAIPPQIAYQIFKVIIACAP